MIFDISKMLDPKVYDHPVQKITLIETHISWVVLTGMYAYKIKKPVNFGFLDFSTLEKRHTLCNQELKLNRRLTSGLYINVVGISMRQNKLRIGNGVAIEYAVKMMQFPQSAQLDNMLLAGKLELQHIDACAHLIANFHQSTTICEQISRFGSPEIIIQPIEENFIQIKQYLHSPILSQYIDRIRTSCMTNFERLYDTLKLRKQNGYIRDCHGDLHLRNLVWFNDTSNPNSQEGPMAFDCIEFSENLRHIDTMNEIAFLIMDLQHRKQFQLASHFLNTYLEMTGDYSGLAVLAFYCGYRAMVRAKVAMLRLQQVGISKTQKDAIYTEFETYVQLANHYNQPTTPKLIIMRGVSASGKSTVSQKIVDDLGFIRIRSDVERKRLYANSSTDSSPSDINCGLYSKEITDQTYVIIFNLATQIINAGYSVVVDAAFLQQSQRSPFAALAKSLKIPFFIVETTAPADTLRQRIAERKNDISDATLNVLEYQLSQWQALSINEKECAISINTKDSFQIDEVVKKLS